MNHAGPRSVLITRPDPGAQETAARIADLGLIPITAPLLEIRPLAARLPAMDKIAAILMASGNAVAPFNAVWHGHPVLTVGDATAQRARHAGFKDVTSAGRNAEALVELVRQWPRRGNGTFLLAAGRGQSLTLASDLRAIGCRVLRRAVYAAVPVAHLPEAAKSALVQGDIRAAMFFSAETARHFMRLVRAAGLLDRLRDLEAITIGERAGMALGTSRWSRIRVAGKPTQQEMLALLR